MSHLLRFLALYDWLEPFDFARNPDIVVGLVENADVKPTKLTVSEPGARKSRRRTLTDKLGLREAIASFNAYTWAALDDPIEGDFRNIRSQIAIIQDRRQYMITKTRSSFTLDDCIKHIFLICTVITPRYGFMQSSLTPEALTFPAGIMSTGSSRETSQRANDWGRSLLVTKEHLAGKLHDVYGLNVLSPPHLERSVQGQPLDSWIAARGRGELRQIKPEVYVWVVPDDVRAEVRSTLFREGALIATV